MGTRECSRYCPYCGKIIPGDASFCSFCGRRIEEVAIPGAGDGEVHRPRESGQTDSTQPARVNKKAAGKNGVHSAHHKPAKRKASPLGIIALSIVVIALIVLVVLFLKKGGPLGISNKGGAEPMLADEAEPVTLTEDRGGSYFSDPAPYTSPNFYVGVWEQKIPVEGAGNFIIHIDFYTPGDVILWNGYENSEIWTYYSGSYTLLEASGNKALLELDVVSVDDELHCITQIEVGLYNNPSNPNTWAIYIQFVDGDDLGMIYPGRNVFDSVNSEPQEAAQAQINSFSFSEAKEKGGLYILRNEEFFPIDSYQLRTITEPIGGFSRSFMGFSYKPQSYIPVVNYQNGDVLVTFEAVNKYSIYEVEKEGYCLPINILGVSSNRLQFAFRNAPLECEYFDTEWIDGVAMHSKDDLIDVLSTKNAYVFDAYVDFLASDEPTTFTGAYYAGTQYTEYEIKLNAHFYYFPRQGTVVPDRTKDGYFIVDLSELSRGKYLMQTGPYGLNELLIEVIPNT